MIMSLYIGKAAHAYFTMEHEFAKSRGYASAISTFVRDLALGEYTSTVAAFVTKRIAAQPTWITRAQLCADPSFAVVGMTEAQVALALDNLVRVGAVWTRDGNYRLAVLAMGEGA